MTESNTRASRHSPTIGLDALHEILKSTRRRYVLRELQRHGTLRETDLVDAIAVREFGNDYSSKERKRISVSLHQSHIPKFIEHNAVVEEGGQYSLGPTASYVIEVLDCSESVTGINTRQEPEGEQYNSVSGWLEKVGLN